MSFVELQETGSGGSGPDLLRSRVRRFLLGPWAGRIALGIWLVYGIVLGAIVAVEPDRRTVTPNYRQAAEKWWEGKQDIYTGKKKGFLYLPQAAILYGPFAALPKRVGEPLWRWAGLAALAWGLWRAGRVFGGASGFSPGGIFLILTALTLPASLASAGNGQMNVLLSALFLHAAVDLAGRSWWRAALILVLALALKPLALVYLLLAGALLPKARWKLAVGLIFLFAAAFVHPDPGYVVRQFSLAGQVFLNSSQPDIPDFCDVAGMFRTFGIVLPDGVWFLVRGVAALGTLGLCWLALRRRSWVGAQLFIYTFAVVYLVLFNPRTEANSYILIAPAVALFAVRLLPVGLSTFAAKGFWVLATYAVVLGCDSYGMIHHWTNLWLKALVTCGFLGWLAWEVLRGREVFPDEPGGTARASR